MNATKQFSVSVVDNAVSTKTRDSDAIKIVERIGSDEWRTPIEYIRRTFNEVLAKTGDLKAAKEAVDPMKKKLPGVLWSGSYSSREKPAHEKLLTHSGLLCADLDNLGARLDEVRAKLGASPYLFALFISPTGNGLKAVFRVPADPQKHVENYRAVERHVHDLTSEAIDGSRKDLAGLCFVSWDASVSLNTAAAELVPVMEAKKSAPATDAAAGMPGIEVRRRISVEMLGAIDWQSETRGFCTCPGQHLHTTDNRQRDCEIHLDGAATVFCFHSHCAAIVTGVNRELRSRIGKAEHANQNPPTAGQCGHTPASWFAEQFPALSDEYGPAVLEETKEDGTVCARDIGEDFLAATLGENGTPEAPTIFLPAEDKFYTYSPSEGIFVQQRDPLLLARLSKLLLNCARACKDGCETRALEFRFRDSASLSGVLRKARGVLEKPHDFFATDLTEFIPCANGMLRLSDRTLLGFSPSYRRRNKLAVLFDPAANCPLFLETLMRPALDPDDLDLLQRWCGLALIGENLAQKILILTGTAGGGKGTFIRVLSGIIGQLNLASLRPQLLGERFELGRFLGKTLLYGADVQENFLNQRGASVLKSLTGYDPATLEFKNSNESPAIICRFNVIVACNSRLTVHLEGDVEAWRRRLGIIDYHKPKPAHVIADLDKRILATESPGVLNWMLEGLDKLRATDWQLCLTEKQQGVVDNLLMESDGHALFVSEEMVRTDGDQLTIQDAFAVYVEFCTQRGWAALTRNKFGQVIGDMVVRKHGVPVRHDILDASSKAQRGWYGLSLSKKNPRPTEKHTSEVSETPFSDESDALFPVQPEKILAREAALEL